MLTKRDVAEIVDGCRKAAEIGLENGCHASIDELVIDFVSPPHDFLGVGDNPAIFVNSHTYKLLGHAHETWKENNTIAVKEHFLQRATIDIIGILVHETGHAFNVAAKIPNTETNAYIFEIEVLARWYQTKDDLLYDCTKSSLQSYLEDRLPFYRKNSKDSDCLAALIEKIERRTLLKQIEVAPDTARKEDAHPFSITTICTTLGFFSHSGRTRLLDEVRVSKCMP